MNSLDSLFLLLRKVVTGLITFVFTFVIVYVPQLHIPKQHTSSVPVAEAAIPVIDGANLVANTGSFIKEKVLDPLAFFLAKAFVSQLLQSLIVWINSGFQGSPAFIQDLDRFLLNVADEAAGEFIRNELGAVGSFICEPFRLNIQAAIALQYQRARTGDLRDREACTLSGVINNIEEFFEGEINRDDFWKQWMRVTSNPEMYTPYGQLMEAEAELSIRLQNRRGQEVQLSSWSGGFLSGKICELIEGPQGPKEKCVISKPGQVIATQLNNMLDTGRQQLVAADEINEVITALLGQIANQALIGAAGLLGLSGGTGYTTGGFGAGSYVDELATTAYSNGSFIEDGITQMRDNLQVSQDYNAMANFYIPFLTAITTNPSTPADVRADAQFALDDAVIVRDDTSEFISILQPLINEFNTLEAEFASTNDTKRQGEIRARQSELISQGTTQRVYTIDRVRLSKQEWSRITGR